MGEYIIPAITNLLHFNNIFVIVIGTIAGIIIGALPGLSSTMGVALLIPLTFKMEPSTGLCMLGAIYCGSVYGGSITAILIRTPGTTASIATSWDGYPLTKQGKGGLAVGYSTIASFMGGIFSAFCLLFLAPPLADFSLRFGPPERFLLAVFGLTIIISISAESPLKGFITAFFGLVISSTGVDHVYGAVRFTFGEISLFEGIPLLPALIGLFSLSQAFILIEESIETKKSLSEKTINKIGKIIPDLKYLKKLYRVILRSSFIGLVIGIIPGAGTSVASYVAYNEAKRSSKNPKEFGKGSLAGVVASESANNAVTGGSLIPLLTLGIPGNAVTAVFLGGLLIHGLIPGPELFTTHAVTTYTLMISLFLSNIALLIFGLIWAKFVLQLTNVPNNILAPIIIVLSIFGSHAMRLNMFDVYLMLIFGVIGYFMEKYKFPLAPIVLALILGPLAELELQRTMSIFRGDLSLFFKRPISIFFIFLIIFSFSISLVRLKKNKSR